MKPFLSFLALTMLLFASLWAIIHPWASHRVSKLLAKIALVLGLALLLMGWWATPAALGEVEFLKEADQWIYQAEQTLPDTGGTQWAIAAFKPMDEDSHRFYVRVTTQSPVVQLDAVAPLAISIPADTLDEWLLVGSCDYLICAPLPDQI